jgi:hypothetical protein
MKIYIMAIIASCLAIVFNESYAQTINISGKVYTPDHLPADAASVLLVQASDSSIVKMALADTSGAYVFEAIGSGSYKVWASLLGYDKYESPVIAADSVPLQLPDIVLHQNSNVLNEVGITARKAFVVQKLDKTVVNVEGMISSTGLSALDVLSRSPGVQVSSNGIISLKGKQGVNIFIDGKPTYLSGEDLENYLKSLPSSAIEQLEIMTNPPAKYDAAGNAGVINIKTKKTDRKGFNAGATLSLNQGKMTRSNNSMDVNYRSGKFNVFANGSYNLNNSFTDLDLNRVYKDEANNPSSYFEQKSYFKRHGNTFNLKTGADYYWSDKTTFGIVLTGMDRKSEQVNNNTSLLLNKNRIVDSIITAENHDDIHYSNIGANLNYRTSFNKTGHELTADADYIAYRNRTDQIYYNNSYFPDKTLKSHDILGGRLPANIDIYSFKADYTLPLMKQWVFSSGLKTAYTHTDNLAEYETTIAGNTTPDYNKSNHFIYNENINAGYLNVSRETDRLSMQFGLRIENTISNGHQMGNLMKPDSSFDRQYTGLFPTVYLSYKFDSMAVNQIGLNYGRRIERPYYQDMNPFISPMDKFTYYTGNPFLKPSYSQSIQLSHTYKNKVTTSLLYSKNKDEIEESIQIVDGIYYSMPGNIGSKIVKSISVDADFDPAKTLNVHLYSELTNIISKGNFFDRQISTSGTYWFISGNIRWTLPHSWTIELNGDYRTKLYNAQFIIGNIWQLNIGVQKKITPDCSLRLSVNDLFYTAITNGTITNLVQADASWRNKRDTRNASLSFSYRIGKTFDNKRKHNANGAESEQNRVKN